MPSFTKKVTVDATQVSFTDEQKAAVRKGIPTTVHGGDLKYEKHGEDDKFFVPLHLNGKTVQANEGDWIVGNDHVQSDEDFKKEHEAVSVVDENAAPDEPPPSAPETSTTVVSENGALIDHLPKE